jgi:hypothetical protein
MNQDQCRRVCPVIDATRRRHCRHGLSSTGAHRNRLVGHENRVGSGEQESAGKALCGDLSFDGRQMAACAVPLGLRIGCNDDLGMSEGL